MLRSERPRSAANPHIRKKGAKDMTKKRLLIAWFVVVLALLAVTAYALWPCLEINGVRMNQVYKNDSTVTYAYGTQRITLISHNTETQITVKRGKEQEEYRAIKESSTTATIYKGEQEIGKARYHMAYSANKPKISIYSTETLYPEQYGENRTATYPKDANAPITIADLLTIGFSQPTQRGVAKYMYVALTIAGVLFLDILRMKKPRTDGQPVVINPFAGKELEADLNILTSIQVNPKNPNVNSFPLALSMMGEKRTYDPYENADAQKIIWCILVVVMVWFVLKAFYIV